MPARRRPNLTKPPAPFREAAGPPELEREIASLEASPEPLFTAGRYRDFFDRVHAIRQQFRRARLTPDVRERLWQRLNRCAEAAKDRQAREFAARNTANLARWHDQLAAAQDYTAALTSEIAELAARRGPPTELAMWQRRIAEKRVRLTSVQSTITELRRKLAAVGNRE